MNEENLILKAYREKEKTSTLKVDIRKNTYGYELYRIVLVLIDKIIKLSEKKEKNQVENFFETMKKNYIKYYSKEE